MFYRLYRWLMGLFGYRFVEFPTRCNPSDPGAYVGSQELMIETVTITAVNRKLTGNWTVEVNDHWPVYPVIADLSTNQQLDDRQWPRTANGIPLQHVPLRVLEPGLFVIWKGSFLDHLWDFGVVVERAGVVYIESADDPAHWAVPELLPGANGYWVTRGVNYTPRTMEFDNNDQQT